MLAVSNSTWRCRFDSSTRSKSSSPSVPMPAAARYSAAGRAQAAGAHDQHARRLQLFLPGGADFGE